MGAEAMGHVVVKLDWWNEKVCRNFLFGTCPHLIFGNTVSTPLSHWRFRALLTADFRGWTSDRARRLIPMLF